MTSQHRTYPHTRGGFSALVALVLLAGFAPAQATPPDGSLDPGFGDGGTKLADMFSYDRAWALARLADGRLLVAGQCGALSTPDFLLARFLPDATLDMTFGTGGAVMTDIAGGRDILFGLAVQPDGRLVVAGTAESGGNADIAVARYLPDGGADPTFGDGGTVTVDVAGQRDEAYAVALQPDGKIVVVGLAYVEENHSRLAVIRLRADGSFDPSFGEGGKAIHRFGSTTDGFAVALQPDGRIVAAGGAGRFELYDAMVGRLNADGSVDTSFGDAGSVRIDFGGGSNEFTALALLPDGKILAAGDVLRSGTWDFAIVRLTAAGALDARFGSEGKVTVDFGGTNDVAYALGVQPDGRTILAGYARHATQPTSDFAMTRFNYDGTLDPGFGAGGMVTTDLGEWDFCHSIVFAPGERFVVAGDCFSATSSDLALACYGAHSGLGVTSARLAKKKLLVSGWDFGEGATVCIDGRPVPTTNDPASPSTTLTAAKARKRIKPGRTAEITVRNVDGRVSNAYYFTRE